MKPRFCQVIRCRCANPDALKDLLKQYDGNQASMEVMGFIGARLLCDRERPGNYLVMAEFAEVDGQRSAAEEAMHNNGRNETTGWYNKFLAAIDGEPEFFDYDEIYWTGITGNLRTG